MASHRHLAVLVGLVAIVGAITESQVQAVTRLYVDPDRPPFGHENGHTWATACRTIEAAVAISKSLNSDVEEIWIADGVYHPPHPWSGLDWDIPLGVSIYGGFRGSDDTFPGEATLAERNLAAHETILSADMTGDDDPNDRATLENNWDDYLIIVNGTGPNGLVTTRIDGFVVEGVYDRGGMWLTTGCHEGLGPIEVVQCGFRDNFVYGDGGLPLIDASGSVTVYACDFYANLRVRYDPNYWNGCFAINMGGCDENDNEPTIPSIASCRFFSNTIRPLFLSGGAASRHIKVINCIFAYNYPHHTGVIEHDNGYFEIINCTFSENATTADCFPIDDYCEELWPENIGVVTSRTSPPYATASEIRLINCIVSGSQSPLFNLYYFINGAPGYPPQHTRTIEHSIVDTAIGGGTAGSGMILADAKLTCPYTGDFRPEHDSPAIDAGDSTRFPDAIIGPYDFLSGPRYYDFPVGPNTGILAEDHPEGIIDMGAIERLCEGCIGDINCDGQTNASDFNILAGNFNTGPGTTRALGDLSGDGFVNASDFNILAGDFRCDLRPGPCEEALGASTVLPPWPYASGP